MELQFAKQKIDELNRTISYMATSMRNAITHLENDDIDECIETLKQWTGE